MKKIVNFRISVKLLERLRLNVPPRQRSEFIRQAVDQYMNMPVQRLPDRPHVQGFGKQFTQVAALIEESVLDRIKDLYPGNSISVVIEVAIISALREFEEDFDADKSAEAH